MKLKNLIKNIEVQQIKGSKEIDITGVCSNSKLVAPGNLFIARRGAKCHGTQYIPEAISAGALAVISDMYDPTHKEVTQIIVNDVNKVEAIVAADYYQHPAKELFMVGITGTNGKTSTAYLVKELLDDSKGPCGLTGTIEYIIGEHRYQATHTTTDVTTNHKLLREMVKQGCKSAVMEVTSHGLTQGRLDHINFDIAVFTNLTKDHLDYHLTMEEYCKAKNILFRSLGKDKVAVVNQDSPWKNSIIEGCKAKVMTYGVDTAATVMATEVMLGSSKTTFTVRYQNEEVETYTCLPGLHNVYNCLAAFTVGIAMGKSMEYLAEKVKKFSRVPGRFEHVTTFDGIDIYVDFAHTPDALKNTLEALKYMGPRRIITVFGCGGDRDRTKRPQMGEIAEKLSDFVFVTSDNPRSEDPKLIIDKIVEGMANPLKYKIEQDRYLAIQSAIEYAKRGDVILIAGKGHETQQIFAHATIPFDDRLVAKEICEKKLSSLVYSG